MRTKYVLNQMTRLGLGQPIIQGNHRYLVLYKGHAISFIDQDGQALCLRVRALGDQDDIKSDYTAGSFVKTWKGAMRLVKL